MLIFNTLFARPVSKMPKGFLPNYVRTLPSFRTWWTKISAQKSSVLLYKYQPVPYVAKPFAISQGENPKLCGSEKQTKWSNLRLSIKKLYIGIIIKSYKSTLVISLLTSSPNILPRTSSPAVMVDPGSAPRTRSTKPSRKKKLKRMEGRIWPFLWRKTVLRIRTTVLNSEFESG